MEIIQYLSKRKNKNQLNCIFNQLPCDNKQDYFAWLNNKSKYVSPKESLIFDVEDMYGIDFLKLKNFSIFQLHVMFNVKCMNMESQKNIKTLEQILANRQKKEALRKIELLKLEIAELENNI